MVQWYYRCEVKGIQSFVMRGKQLKEIAGASALVESMFSTDEQSQQSLIQQAKASIFKEKSALAKVVYCAAGGATMTFDDPSGELLKQWVTEWPLWVDENLPGIHLIQAWVSAEEIDSDFNGNQVRALAQKLSVARNTPPLNLPQGTPVIDMGVRGGLAVFDKDIANSDESFQDRTMQRQLLAATNKSLKDQLRNRFLSEDNRSWELPLDHEKLSGGGSAYLAVIHIDGNRVGRLLKDFETMDAFKSFSQCLSQATEQAVRYACDKSLLPTDDKDLKAEFVLGRPVVVGGDDVTAIVRADRALAFTRNYIEEFERQTHTIADMVRDDIKGLTASAGIAFIRKNHPFSDALHLAEDLCKHAKKAWTNSQTTSRGETTQTQGPSMIAFQRVTSALSAIDYPNASCPKYRMGPYYLSNGLLTEDAQNRGFICLDNLEELASAVQHRDVAQGRVRTLVDLISVAKTYNDHKGQSFSESRAEQEWARIKQVHTEREQQKKSKFWNHNDLDSTVPCVMDALKYLVPHTIEHSQSWTEHPWIPIWSYKPSSSEAQSERRGSPWVDVYDLIGSGAVSAPKIKKKDQEENK